MELVDSAPQDRFCDLVMKGGIASGIVYPLAIAQLCTRYRFRSIGGTSAGAVAASVTAAAEYARRTNGSMRGFEILANLPKELRTWQGDARRLKLLFKPQPECARVFQVMLRALNRPNTRARLAAIVTGSLAAYWPATVAGALLGLIAGVLSSVLAGVLLAIVAAVAFIVAWMYRDITRGVVHNGFGLCNGMSAPDVHREAITPWLHRLVQSAAGRNVDADPLTFGDLWDAPGGPPPQSPPVATSPPRSIDLQMFTTSLAHGRPYVFPHTDEQARLFFRTRELAPYLPEKVMDWLLRHSPPYEPRRPDDPPREVDDGLPEAMELGEIRELPAPREFPILLAARMSLSFPLLFSAIPLWAICYEDPPKARGFRRCWFSDGGIASNFPLHLFDGLLPSWPTFGIQLEPQIPGGSIWTTLPTHYLEGFDDHWDRFDDEPTSSDQFQSFLLSVAAATQNWNDNTLARMPGFRDRVVRVRLSDDEGGFNLDMDAKVQERVADRGSQAAEALIARFVPPAGALASAGWNDQRWIRMDVLIRMLSKRLPGIEFALKSSTPHATAYDKLVKEAQHTAPAGHEAALTGEEAAALRDILTLFRQVASKMNHSSGHYSHTPIPEPELRVRPPL